MVIIIGHRVPTAPATLMTSTFSVLREPDSSELSCTSMSGSWYLQNTELKTLRSLAHRLRKYHNLPWRSPVPGALARALLEPAQPAGFVRLCQSPQTPLFPPPSQLCQPPGHLSLDPTKPEEFLVLKPGSPQCSLLHPLWTEGKSSA